MIFHHVPVTPGPKLFVPSIASVRPTLTGAPIRRPGRLRQEGWLRPQTFALLIAIWSVRGSGEDGSRLRVRPFFFVQVRCQVRVDVRAGTPFRTLAWTAAAGAASTVLIVSALLLWAGTGVGTLTAVHTASCVDISRRP